MNKKKFDIIIIIGYKEGEHYPLDVTADHNVVDDKYEYWANLGFEVGSESREMEIGVDKKTGELIWLD